MVHPRSSRALSVARRRITNWTRAAGAGFVINLARRRLDSRRSVDSSVSFLILALKEQPEVKRSILFLAIIIATLVSLPALVGGQRKSRSVWPNKEGVYLATSSETIPQFARVLTGYRSTGNMDYWDHPFTLHGSIRIFQGNGWEGIPDFPMTMNHCSDGLFMFRWRSANPDVRLESALGYHYSGVIFARKTGTFGYMQGHNCEEPLFKIAGIRNRNESTLVDVYYKLKFWRAAP